MPVCSRPFHHACSPPSLFPTQLYSRSSFLARFSPDMCLIFTATADFRPRQHAPHLCASAYQSFVSFFPITLPRLSSLPCPGDSFVTIGIRMPPSRLASHFSQLMYQFLIAPSLISCQRSILCHIYILLATYEISYPDKIHRKNLCYILEKKRYIYINIYIYI